MAKKLSALIGHDDVTKRVEYEVPEDEPDFWGADHQFAIAGEKKVRRLDAFQKVTGKAKYAHDINRPGMLYAALTTCPLAYAKIKNVDISQAAKMAGVKAIVVTGDKEARFAGWTLAAVAADTIQQARDAALRVKVEYEELPFVVDGGEAMKADSPKIRTEGNVGKSRQQDRGDIQKGFQEAEAIHEAEYETPVTPHNTLETHGCVAEWIGDELTVWDSTQAMWSNQRSLAQSLGISINKVRVITQFMGGGFGSKLGLESFAVLCAKLAKEAKRPVKLMADRYADTTGCGNKPAAIMRVKIGAKQDGTLTAVSLKSFNIVGHSGGGGVAPPFLDFYDCPNVHIDESNVWINAGASRPFRAPGHPQGSFGMEMAIEELAVKLGADPLEMRLKNVSVSELDARFHELKLGADKFGWKEKFKKHGSEKGRMRRGVGCAVTYWPYYGSPGGAIFRCTIFPDGSVEMANSVQDIGTGCRTMIAVAAAETLGIGVEAIRVTVGDTQLGLIGPTSGGSVTTPTTAPAVRSAAYKAQRQLFERAARKWETNVDDIECQDSIVFRKSVPATKMSWKELAAMIGGGSIAALGEHIDRPRIEGMNIGTPVRGAQFAEVEVDAVMGKVHCLKILAVHDAGKTIAKTQAESQICGGVIQGVSFALLENRIMDNMAGRQVNANMENYKIIGPLEVPEIETVIVDVFDPVNNASAKGLGEPPHIPTAAAIGCAVFNAIGVPIRSLPITPDKVLAALQGKEG